MILWTFLVNARRDCWTAGLTARRGFFPHRDAFNAVKFDGPTQNWQNLCERCQNSWLAHLKIYQIPGRALKPITKLLNYILPKFCWKYDFLSKYKMRFFELVLQTSTGRAQEKSKWPYRYWFLGWSTLQFPIMGTMSTESFNLNQSRIFF